MTAATWRGRHGAVLLGPAEDRVARYLVDATRHGRVTLRMMDIAARLGLERSEAYRITARLRMLGLFGVENDRGGTKGGRRWWRTPTPNGGTGLDAGRHRVAWSRILAWSRARRARVLAIAGHHMPDRSTARYAAGSRHESPAGGSHAPHAIHAPAGLSFREMFAAAGGAELLKAWHR